MRIVHLVSVLVLTLVLGACTSKRIYNVNHAPIPVNQSLETTGKLITKALRYKRWKVELSAPGKIIASIKVRKHTATIKIEFNDKSFTIEHVKSRNLDYDVRDNTIHRNYNKWISLLKDEVNYYFANPKVAATDNH